MPGSRAEGSWNLCPLSHSQIQVSVRQSLNAYRSCPDSLGGAPDCLALDVPVWIVGSEPVSQLVGSVWISGCAVCFPEMQYAGSSLWSDCSTTRVNVYDSDFQCRALTASLLICHTFPGLPHMRVSRILVADWPLMRPMLNKSFNSKMSSGLDRHQLRGLPLFPVRGMTLEPGREELGSWSNR